MTKIGVIRERPARYRSKQLHLAIRLESRSTVQHFLEDPILRVGLVGPT